MEEATVLISRLQNGERELRTVLIEENMGLVKHIAKRFIGRGTEMEDLIQIAVIGLIKAIDHFDLSYEVKFSTYAVPLIMGELKRHFRDDGMIKVSRNLKEQNMTILKAEEEYRNRYGKDPSMEEIMMMTKLSREEIILAVDASKKVESLYTTIPQQDGSELLLMDQIVSIDGQATKVSSCWNGKDEEKEKMLNRVFIKEIMTGLSEKEKQIIKLRFFDELTQSEVAKRLVMTQVQVSRLEKKILQSLRKKYKTN